MPVFISEESCGMSQTLTALREQVNSMILVFAVFSHMVIFQLFLFLFK